MVRRQTYWCKPSNPLYNPTLHISKTSNAVDRCFFWGDNLPTITACRGFGAVISPPDVEKVYCRFGEFHVQVLQSAGDDLRDCQIAEPFVIRGNNEPGRVPSAGPIH